MTPVVWSATAAALDAAHAMLRSRQDWPDPASGFAYRIFQQAGTALPDFAALPLKPTSAALLRRTPELAAYGYVCERSDDATRALWLDAIEHLRGRDVYPSDRQSFIFNPVEILGVAAGLVTPPLEGAGHREWFANTIERGIQQGQFRSPLSMLAARVAKAVAAETSAAAAGLAGLTLPTLATPEMLLVAGMAFAFGSQTGLDKGDIEKLFVQRLLTQPLPINDAGEAAVVSVLCQRLADELVLGSSTMSAVDTIVSLCRRLPAMVHALQKRQRQRQPFSIADEYDVQDLLHGVLKLHFDDVRPEEYTPSYAGNSSRVDFFLPRERLIVEAKMTRSNLGQKEIVNELSIDTVRYANMQGVETLICLVYDPDHRCANPIAIESDVANGGGRLAVHVVICPQRI